MKPFYFNLKYLNILEVVGFFIKEGITCEVVPIDKERAYIHFDEVEHGERARKRLIFLKSVPIHSV